MAGFTIAHEHYWQPLRVFGLTGSFWQLNAITIINTWVVLGIIIFLIIAARLVLRREESIGSYIVCSFAQSFKDLVTQTLGFFDFNHFSFVTSLFCFIFLCNIISIIPWLEEPTQDLSTTLGLAIIALTYAHFWSIKTQGLRAYLHHFIQPFAFMLPLNIIESFAKIVSLSFRLFGNIFGVAVISKLYLHAISSFGIIGETIGIMSGINIIIVLFFVLFDGGIQAYVFSMLSLTYLGLEMRHDEE